MKSYLFTSTLYLIVIIIFSGCGFTTDSANQNKYPGNNINHPPICHIDDDAFYNFFSKDKTEEITCIKSNLVSFIHYVERDNENHIDKGQLKEFLNKFFQTQDDIYLNILTSSFMINEVLFLAPSTQLDVNNIGNLTKIVALTNQVGISIFNLIKTVDSDSFWDKREKLSIIIDNFITQFKKITKITKEQIDASGKYRLDRSKLNLTSFFNVLQRIVNNANISSEDIQSFLIFKKISVGGQKNILSAVQVELLMRKIKTLFILYFDINFACNKHFPTRKELTSFYLNRLMTIHSLIFSEKRNFIITKYELISLIDHLLYFDQGCSTVSSILKLLKFNLTIFPKKTYSSKTLKIFFQIVYNILEKRVN